eukprot:542185_1
MANVVDWSLKPNALRRQLLQLSKPKLIKCCKYKNISYGGNKNDIIDKLLKASIDSTKKSNTSTTVNTSDKSNTKHNQKTKNGYIIPSGPRLDGLARILLLAVYDDNNIFSALRGMRFIVKAIWEFAVDFNTHYIMTSDPDDERYLHSLSSIQFPFPHGININMMPFISSYNFEGSKLPSYLKTYYEQVIFPVIKIEYGKIYYLTIHESIIEAGRSQRRPGLHVELPGKLCIVDDEKDNSENNYKVVKGGGSCTRILWTSAWG